MKRVLVYALFMLLAACGGDDDDSGRASVDAGPPADAAPQRLLATEVVADGLAGPVAVALLPGEDRLLVVEQGGTIEKIDGTSVLPGPFLDVTDLVDVGSERGLLGIAVPADWKTSRRFFIAYTASGSGDITLAERAFSPDDDTIAVAGPGIVLHSHAHPRGNHNGSWLGFGPDGMLYMSTGDGGDGGDPDEAGQRLDTYAGKLLRFDVSTPGIAAIPADNPFVGQGGPAGYIWAFGLRNPWRNSFDSATGDLYIADVGQDQWEEIDVEPAGSAGGVNYGWDDMEGTHCYEPSQGCNMADHHLPVYEYQHGDGDCIIGGYVYHGSALPELDGHYVFGDYTRAWIRSVHWDGAAGVDDVRMYPELDGLAPSCFGIDASGELLICDPLDGQLLRLIPTP
jgi:glucose/arabinose dehydrogenase